MFVDWQFFCVLRELIFAIRTDWFFLLGINYPESTQCLALIINLFLLSTGNRNIILKQHYGIHTLCNLTDTIS